MILWQSPHVDVNRNQGSVCAGRTNGDYPDPGRISMIKRASAAQKVATSEGSRPGASVCSLTLGALGGQVSPGQLTSGAAKGR
jgi:hypothetical protein